MTMDKRFPCFGHSRVYNGIDLTTERAAATEIGGQNGLCQRTLLVVHLLADKTTQLFLNEGVGANDLFGRRVGIENRSTAAFKQTANVALARTYTARDADRNGKR